MLAKAAGKEESDSPCISTFLWLEEKKFDESFHQQGFKRADLGKHCQDILKQRDKMQQFATKAWVVKANG